MATLARVAEPREISRVGPGWEASPRCCRPEPEVDLIGGSSSVSSRHGGDRARHRAHRAPAGRRRRRSPSGGGEVEQRERAPRSRGRRRDGLRPGRSATGAVPGEGMNVGDARAFAAVHGAAITPFGEGDVDLSVLLSGCSELLFGDRRERRIQAKSAKSGSHSRAAEGIAELQVTFFGERRMAGLREGLVVSAPSSERGGSSVGVTERDP